jgi:DMSO/TMAO reductase YedYZ molybdopterin-dependent catalytic subunit
MRIRRRRFIHCSICASSTWALGCGDGRLPRDSGLPMGDSSTTEDAALDTASGPTCDDVFRGGTFVATVPFSGVDVPFGVKVGAGWDGRLYTDLSAIDAGNVIVPNDLFYIRTHFPDLLVPPPSWTVAVRGLVETEQTLVLDDLLPMVEDKGAHVLECSGNGPTAGFGLMSAAEWAGIDVMAVLDTLPISPGATRVLIRGFDDHSVPSVGGHSTPGASWIFTFEQLAEAGAFFATEMNGQPLPNDHGAPLRLFVPGWYGCTCIKWVNEIVLVDEDEPATAQMMEFASRTHQRGTPTSARDYIPASLDQAATATRVERWMIDGAPLYKVIGVMWGGYEPTNALLFRDGTGTVIPVDVCPPQTQNALWTVFQHPWRPSAVGDYELSYFIDDDAIPQRRLASGFYNRAVRIDAV